jgi:ABC-type dipeptide/oligopeptide/nickel transport system permease subunit
VAQRGTVGSNSKTAFRLLLAMLGIFVIAVVFFAVKLPVVGGVLTVVAIAVGIVGWVRMARASRQMREWARSVNSDGDKQPR